MSDLTDAIEALRKVFDSQEGSYMYTKGYLDESDFELMLATAGPIIEAAARADERAKVARRLSDYRNSPARSTEAKRALWQAIRIADEATALILRGENAASTHP